MTQTERQHDHPGYGSPFGVLGGYLPQSREAIRHWHLDLKEKVRARLVERGPEHELVASVARLRDAISASGVLRMYVEKMIATALQPLNQPRGIEHVGELLEQLDYITGIAPEWEEDEKKRNFFPMSALFNEMMMDEAGQSAWRYPPFNDAIREILKTWCLFLCSPASAYVLNEGPNGWLSPSAYAYNKLDDFVIPDRKAEHWGWTSFNDFFHREIKPECRPIAEPDNPKVIVSPNDGTVYRVAEGVQPETRFWVKGEPYCLHDMLAGNAYVERFLDGWVFQSYLSGANYHRWHAPVDGTVKEAYVVDGLMFSNIINPDIKGTENQAYYTAVNTRGLTFIEADDPQIGMVCCMPVGITEVSSITLTADRGDRVKKGDELGYFSYGGSTVAVVFERDAIDHFTVEQSEDPKHATTIEVNAQIAVAQ